MRKAIMLNPMERSYQVALGKILAARPRPVAPPPREVK